MSGPRTSSAHLLALQLAALHLLRHLQRQHRQIRQLLVALQLHQSLTELVLVLLGTRALLILSQARLNRCHIPVQSPQQCSLVRVSFAQLGDAFIQFCVFVKLLFHLSLGVQQLLPQLLKGTLFRLGTLPL